MKIYITHYTPLTIRKKNIIRQLKTNNIDNYEIIEKHDREKLTQIDIKKFSGIKLSETSLFLKHIEIFKKEVNNNEIVIVLEDDAIFVDKFKEKLYTYIKELEKKKNWDVIFTGDCLNLHIKADKENLFYPTNMSRGTCMYILNVGVCKKLLDIINIEKNINQAIDHWFNLIQKKYNLKYYWSEPVLVKQGSELGIYKSSIGTGKKNTGSNFYSHMLKFTYKG
jgi:GR25 family glycosyltransferase involved in LPS biosynthesis